VTGGVDDGVVVVGREELLAGARDGDTARALVLLVIHDEGVQERLLAQSGGLGLELLQLALRHAAQQRQQTTRHGRLAGVDVAGDGHGQMLLVHVVLGGGHGDEVRGETGEAGGGGHAREGPGPGPVMALR